ncbi:hypothetical protein LOY90_006830, partial [Ophidiomyces ophidiicola]
EHVCERHVGRKSTNNLNLTCSWGNCRTTTVKRDHITSHIRVHVPLKPHKCDFCGKAFKRPQDLKKHVKTHADDSVLVRSPEPGHGARPPNGMFGVTMGPDGKTGHYFESALGHVPGAPYGHPHAPFYHPQQQHPQHPQHPANPSYGNVYYAVGSDATHQASYESKKRGYDALNEFFGDLKRRQFDPTSYAAIGQRLLNLHGLPLPLVHAAAVPEYQPMPAMVAVGGHGGYHAGPIPAQSYHLPPMGNLRTKTDLMNIDQFLEQMQTTVYESDENVAAAGVAQPGAHFVHGALSYRTTNSPPTASHLPSSHANAPAAADAAATPQVLPASARSPHSVTPSLTPPSSAQSYTSGRSPVSLASTHHIPPSSHAASLPQSSASMYPTLPTSSAQESAAAGYPNVSGTAPPSTLSSMFDNDDRRRYTGGMLQRSRMDYTDAMDMSTNGSNSPNSTVSHHDKVSDSMIDPFLRRASSDRRSSTPTARRSSGSGSSPDSSDTPRNNNTTTSRSAEDMWVENVRLLQRLRDYIRDRLYQGDFEQENRRSPSYSQDGGLSAGEMQGMQAVAAATAADDDRDEARRNEGSGGELKTESLYPVLKLDGDDDGDAKMKMDE